MGRSKKDQRLDQVLNLRVDLEMRKIIEELAMQRKKSMGATARALIIAGLAAGVLHGFGIIRRGAADGA